MIVHSVANLNNYACFTLVASLSDLMQPGNEPEFVTTDIPVINVWQVLPVNPTSQEHWPRLLHC